MSPLRTALDWLRYRRWSHYEHGVYLVYVTTPRGRDFPIRLTVHPHTARGMAFHYYGLMPAELSKVLACKTPAELDFVLWTIAHKTYRLGGQ